MYKYRLLHISICTYIVMYKYTYGGHVYISLYVVMYICTLDMINNREAIYHAPF